MKRAISISVLLLCLLGTGRAEGRVATIRCRTTVSTYSWHPLPLKTIGRLVEGRVLQAITRSGKLTLQPAGARSKPPDMDLNITARIIEDAGQFSVFLTAVPRRQDKAGSLAAVSTLSIRNKKFKGIQLQMERAANTAAAKLEALLSPNLLGMARDGLEKVIVPVDPEGRSSADWASSLHLKGGKTTRLGNASALQQFSVRAQKEAGARMALANCATSGGTKPGLRSRCIDALAQLARRHPSAQRAIVAVLFQPPPGRRASRAWSDARRRAFRISTGFTGVALDEAIQAWLHILASDHSDQYHLFGGRREDYMLMETISKYFARRSSVPNLDLALAQCSRPAKKKGAPPDSYCLKVMKSVPLPRRLALLYRQLSAPVEYSLYERWRGWTGMLQTVIDRNKPLHPAVEHLCKKRVLRSFWDVDRKECLRALGSQGLSTAKLARFLVRVFLSADKGIYFAIRDALRDLMKRKPALCPVLERSLGERVARGAFPMYYRSSEVPQSLSFCRKQSKAL